MFKRYKQIISYLKRQNLTGDPRSEILDTSKPQYIEYIPTSINDVMTRMWKEFDRCEDIIMRQLEVGVDKTIKMLVVYFDGMIDKNTLNAHVLRPLLIDARIAPLEKSVNKRTIINIMVQNLVDNCEVLEITDFNQCLSHILSGDTMVFIDGLDIALSTSTKGFQTRAVDEPETEASVRGSREGFVESFRVNTSLLRRRIKNPALKIESMTIGQQTQTKVGIAYVDGIVDKRIVDEVRKRLSRIRIDSVLESGILEEFIQDSPAQPVPTVGNSERPDKVAAKLLEGRVAIITDGTPFVLTVPFLFIEGFQTTEDYYSLPIFSSFVRILRFIAFIISVYAPAIYVAMLGFHQSVVPFKLVMTVTAARQGLPFNSFTEALIMGAAFELLREAGVRMPRPVGQAVSIVGALVLGEASIRAGITGAPMVIVTAITAICSFIVTPYNGFMPMARLALLIAANIMGLMGIALVSAAGLIHMCSLRSFGVSYMAPFAPLSPSDLKDTIIRLPLWMMFTRPKSFTDRSPRQNRVRMALKISDEDNEE